MTSSSTSAPDETARAAQLVQAGPLLPPGGGQGVEVHLVYCTHARQVPPRASDAVEIHQDEILTGEAVALDVQPIGYFLRALGVLIDVLLGVALLRAVRARHRRG